MSARSNWSGLAIRLAAERHVHAMALMSRDLVEHGLVWRYTADRIAALMRAPDVNAAVAESDRRLAGFAIMEYREASAHLVLLAVRPAEQRRGTGRALVGWLEAVAETAGLQQVSVEVRPGNAAARALYAALGYRETQRLAGYYDGLEDGLRLVKQLHTGV